MFMRYEWGLAVGHTYAHADSVSAIQSIIGSKTTLERGIHQPASAAQRGGGSRSEVGSNTSNGDAAGVVRTVPTSTVQSGEGSRSTDVPMHFPSNAMLNGAETRDHPRSQDLMDAARNAIGDTNYGVRSAEGNGLEYSRENDEDNEGEREGEDEEEGEAEDEAEGEADESDDGSIETDATSVRGYSDEEDERLASLYGGGE